MVPACAAADLGSSKNVTTRCRRDASTLRRNPSRRFRVLWIVVPASALGAYMWCPFRRALLPAVKTRRWSTESFRFSAKKNLDLPAMTRTPRRRRPVGSSGSDRGNRRQQRALRRVAESVPEPGPCREQDDRESRVCDRSAAGLLRPRATPAARAGPSLPRRGWQPRPPPRPQDWKPPASRPPWRCAGSCPTAPCPRQVPRRR